LLNPPINDDDFSLDSAKKLFLGEQREDRDNFLNREQLESL